MSCPGWLLNKSNLRAAAVVGGGLVLVAFSYSTVTCLVEICVAVLVLLGGIEVLSRPVGMRSARTN